MKTFHDLVRILTFGTILMLGFSCDDDDKKSATSSLKSKIEADTWRVNYFFDSQDETYHFTDYIFTFNEDGTVVAARDASAVNGTWSVESSSNGKAKLILDFEITEPFDELNDDWNVMEQTEEVIRLEDVSGGSGEVDLLTFERVR